MGESCSRRKKREQGTSRGEVEKERSRQSLLDICTKKRTERGTEKGGKRKDTKKGPRRERSFLCGKGALSAKEASKERNLIGKDFHRKDG